MGYDSNFRLLPGSDALREVERLALAGSPVAMPSVVITEIVFGLKRTGLREPRARAHKDWLLGETGEPGITVCVVARVDANRT